MQPDLAGRCKALAVWRIPISGMYNLGAYGFPAWNVSRATAFCSISSQACPASICYTKPSQLCSVWWATAPNAPPGLAILTWSAADKGLSPTVC